MDSLSLVSRSPISGSNAFLLVNQHGGDTKPYITLITNILAAAGISCDIGEFEHSYGHQVAKNAVESGKYSYMLAFGGDGTINKAASAICSHNSDIALVPLPGGTFNHFSNLTYGNRNSHKPWLNVLRMLEGQKVMIDIGKLSIKDSVFYFLLSISLGVQAKALKYVPKKLKYLTDRYFQFLGTGVVFVNALMHLAKYKKYPCKLSDDTGKTWSGLARALFIAKANYRWEKDYNGALETDGHLLSGAIVNYTSYALFRLDSPLFVSKEIQATISEKMDMEIDGGRIKLGKLNLADESGSLTLNCNIEQLQIVKPAQIYSTSLIEKLKLYFNTLSGFMKKLLNKSHLAVILGQATTIENDTILVAYCFDSNSTKVLKLCNRNLARMTGCLVSYSADKTSWGLKLKSISIA